METHPDLMLLAGVMADCTDCGSAQILVPVDRAGEYCCTTCDAAVFLVEVFGPDDLDAPGRRDVGAARPVVRPRDVA